jgi:hypothetical protein
MAPSTSATNSALDPTLMQSSSNRPTQRLRVDSAKFSAHAKLVHLHKIFGPYVWRELRKKEVTSNSFETTCSFVMTYTRECQFINEKQSVSNTLRYISHMFEWRIIQHIYYFLNSVWKGDWGAICMRYFWLKSYILIKYPWSLSIFYNT